MGIRLLLLLSAVSFACACANKTVAGPDYNSVRQRSDQAQQDLERQSNRPGQ